MPGVSSHFDHTTGRHVMGQQVLTLGLSCTQSFVPIDSELFTGKTKVVDLAVPFKDGRSIAAQRHRAAVLQTKPEMARAMIARAQRAGIEALYLLADAWFGTKPMIAMAEDALLTAVVRMKKNTMKYRHSLHLPDKVVCKEMDVCALYQSAVRGQWEKIAGQPYQSKTLVVDLNLNDPKDEVARWIKVRLLLCVACLAQTRRSQVNMTGACFSAPMPILSPSRCLSSMPCAGPLRCISRSPSSTWDFSRSRHVTMPVMSPPSI